jgi:hypothetical protein
VWKALLLAYFIPKFATKMSATATVAVLFMASSGDQKPIESFLFVVTLAQEAKTKYSHCRHRHHWWVLQQHFDDVEG